MKSSQSGDIAGVRAGLAALAVGVIVNIAWLLSFLVAMLRLAFAD